MKNRIWAHRGSSHSEPENTMAAFEQAIRDQADGIEIDVQFTKDGQVVVVHDEHLKRLAGVDRRVQELGYDEIRHFNIAHHWKDCASFHRIPLLSEVLDLLKPTDMVLNVELKNSTYLMPGLEEACIDLVKASGLEEQVLYSSFNHYSMRKMADLGYGAQSGLLYAEMLVEPWLYAKQLGVGALHPLYTNLQLPNYVAACVEAGIRIHAWTIDSPEHLGMALQLGLDAIITDEPRLAIELRDK